MIKNEALRGQDYLRLQNEEARRIAKWWNKEVDKHNRNNEPSGESEAIEKRSNDWVVEGFQTLCQGSGEWSKSTWFLGPKDSTIW